MHRILTVVAAALLGIAFTVMASTNPVGAATPTAQRVCAASAPGFASCLSWIRTDAAARVAESPNARPLATPAGFGPSSLLSAYNVGSAAAANGAGVTVGIVDAFNDPNAFSDVNTYRAQFGVPALASCTPTSVKSSTTACFAKSNETGGTRFPRTDSGWAAEESLDIDMVSAICPKCNILLVEASSATINDLGSSVNEAVTLGAKYVSNSYGGSEGTGETTAQSSFYDHPGAVLTASSGDSGFGVEFPAASQDVVAVGGTSLSTASNARGWTETAWSGAGSGCSTMISKPSWQTDSGCARRTVADVSAVADPNTGVAVFDSTPIQGQSGFLVFGGTSVASPVIASVYALAGNAASVNFGSSLYSHAASLNDVTSGSNGTCSPSYLCTAGPGYDGPTGLGTPNGIGAF